MGAFDDLVPARSGAFDDLIQLDSGEGMVKTAAKNLAAGAVGTAAAGLKGLAVLNADVAEMPSPYASLMRQAGAAGPPEGQRTYQAGQRLDRVVAEDIAPNPRYRNSFWASTLPQGLGSTVALLPTAIAGPAGIATSGALVSGGAAYDEAKAAGADDDAAHRVFWQNALAGTTEAIPLSRILDRINKSSGGTLSRAVRDMLSSGLEEGAQEAFQQTVGNLVARHAYDDERRLLEGVGQGGAAGFITGALFAGAGTGGKRLLDRGQDGNRRWTRMDADGGQTGMSAPEPSPAGTPPPGPTGEAVPPGTPGAGSGPTAVPPVPTSVDDVRRLVGAVTTPEALANLLQDAGVQQAVATASPVEQQTLTLAVQERALELEQGSQESEVGSPKSEVEGQEIPSTGAFEDLVPQTPEEDVAASVDRTRINAGPAAPQEPATEAAGDVPAAVETVLPAGPAPLLASDQSVAPTEMVPSGVVPVEDQAAIREELDAELGQTEDADAPAPTPAAQPEVPKIDYAKLGSDLLRLATKRGWEEGNPAKWPRVDQKTLDRLAEKYGTDRYDLLTGLHPELRVNQGKDGLFWITRGQPAESAAASDAPSPEQRKGQATGTGVQTPPARPEPVAPPTQKRKPSVAMGMAGRTRFRNEEEASGPDILSFLAGQHRIVSKSAAKAKGKAWWTKNGSLYDDAPKIAPHHGLIYSDTGVMPDVAAQAAFEAHLIDEPSVNALWAAVSAASRARLSTWKRNQSEAKLLDQMARQLEAWEKATAQGPLPITTEDLAPGDVLDVEGERVKVRDRDPDTGDVTLDDGRRFGRQTLPEGKTIWAEKFVERAEEGAADFAPAEADTPSPAPPAAAAVPRLRPGEAVGEMFQGADQPFNLAGETTMDGERIAREKAQREQTRREADEFARKNQTDMFGGRSSSANARGVQAFPGGPIGTGPARPADNPQFSAFPLALPEAVETVQALLRGQVPKLKERLRILAGNALGVFRHRDDAGQAEIELRRDLWMLDDEALARLKTEAEMYAQRTEPTPGAEQDRIRQEYLDHLVKEHAKSNPPLIALKVLWHEIGHLVDWLPQHRITGRGNLFGHIAALKKYLRHSLPMGPGIADNPVTAADKARLRKEAEAELHRELGGLREIIERIVVDEPVYAQLKITPEDVKALFGMDARERTPELYRWFAGLPDEAKVEIVRKAMKGILDERLNSVAGTQQVGTRKVERIVRRREGREPTKAEILERFRRKFREELARRQMADLDLLKDELRGLIAWWNGTATMPDYFKTPEEMYAEAFSAFVNNPAAVAERAPTFYRMVHAYMEARPEVAEVYARLQDAMRQGTIMPHRVARLREMWRQADADGMDFQKGRDATRTRDALDNVLYHVDRVFGPMYRRARRSNRPAPVRQAIGDYLYRAADHERFLTRSNAEVGKPLVDANLDWADFGEYLFHKHITESRYVRDPQTGVLRPIANPYGWSADESAKRLAELEAQLGPQRWAVLVNAQRAFRRLYEEMVVEPLRRSGLATGPLMDAITNRVFYATFAAVKDKAESGIDTLFDASFGSGVGAKIFHQVGNLGRIKNPATATVLKALSLTSAIHRNNLKRELVALMRETDPTMIRPADTRWNGRRQEPVIRDTETVGTLVVMEEGKPQAYYVPRQMADMVDAGPVTTNWFMLRAMQATRGLKSLFTQINYGFWPVAFMRDAVSWTMQMPGATTPLHWARLMPSSIQAARDSVRNIRPNRLADEFLRRRMAISRASPAGFHDVTDNEYDLAVASYGLNPAQWAKEADRQHALARAWQWWRETGQIFERAHKIAGMQYLDRQHPNMPEWKKQEIVRERAGSPDFLQKGRSNPYIDFVAMFYNPWKEGLRSVVKSARENPWSFTAKGTALVIAPTVLQGLASAGMFGDDLRDAYRSIPDYDATNYLCLPLFWADKQDGKVAYLRLPLWEPARILHGTLYKTITGRGQGYASYLGGQVPGMNPLIDVVTAWATYEVAGQNPYDAYRGQHWLSEDVLKAGGWAARQEMLKQTWNNLGGGIVGTFKQVRLDEPPPGTVEQALSIPVISNLAGRWVKVSNRGLYDRDRQLGIPIDQYRAQVRLSVAPVVEKILTGQALSQSERVLMREPYAQEYLRARLPKAARERASVLADRLSRATTKEQRQAILRGASN